VQDKTVLVVESFAFGIFARLC